MRASISRRGCSRRWTGMAHRRSAWAGIARGCGADGGGATSIICWRACCIRQRGSRSRPMRPDGGAWCATFSRCGATIGTRFCERATHGPSYGKRPSGCGDDNAGRTCSCGHRARPQRLLARWQGFTGATPRLRAPARHRLRGAHGPRRGSDAGAIWRIRGEVPCAVGRCRAPHPGAGVSLRRIHRVAPARPRPQEVDRAGDAGGVHRADARRDVAHDRRAPGARALSHPARGAGRDRRDRGLERELQHALPAGPARDPHAALTASDAADGRRDGRARPARRTERPRDARDHRGCDRAAGRAQDGALHESRPHDALQLDGIHVADAAAGARSGAVDVRQGGANAGAGRARARGAPGAEARGGMTRRTRVLHVIQNLNYGGMERLLADIVRRADPERFESHVLVLQYLGRFADGLREHAELHVAEPMSRWSMVWPASLAQTIRGIAPDVVHTHSGVWYKTTLAARQAGVPRLIHTEHGRQTPDPWQSRVVDGLASRRTNVVVAVSEALAAQLARTVV